MSRTYKSEAIILSRKNYSEADRILTLYTKNYGKLTVIAKGVRNPKSRKRGALEVFTQISFSAVKGKNMDIITEAIVIDSFDLIREDLAKVSVAYFMMEIINKTSGESEENLMVYKQLVQNLNTLQTRSDLKKFRHEFVHEHLSRLGFWPEDNKIKDYDQVLEEILERKISSKRVGKALLS